MKEIKEKEKDIDTKKKSFMFIRNDERGVRKCEGREIA